MSELEQTIEQLEAEVLAELEEVDAEEISEAPEKLKANKEDGSEEEINNASPLGKVEPIEKAVNDPDDALGPKASKSTKPVAHKTGGKPDAPKKLAAGDEVDHDGEELKENKKLTKAQHLENIAKMKKADIEEMLATHASKLEEAESAETEEALKKLEDAKAEIEEKIKNISVKEDVEALVSGDDTLSEEFKTKAATIFEAAVKSRVRSAIERIEEQSQSEKEIEMDTFKEEIAEKVDTYLNYVVEEWTKENELAIERGLKGEIAEDFISGLKQLFEDHYIDVPDEKYDVLEAQSEKISELEEKLNEAIQKSVDLTSSNEKLVREQVISEVSEDLADTEIEKFKSLTQDVDFGNEASFREKLDTLKENYFPKSQPISDKTIDDEDGSTAQDVDTTDAMKTYMSAISRNQKASA